MSMLITINIIIYAGIFIALLCKIIERLKEKSKDDDDLNKYDKY